MNLFINDEAVYAGRCYSGFLEPAVSGRRKLYNTAGFFYSLLLNTKLAKFEFDEYSEIGSFLPWCKYSTSNLYTDLFYGPF